MTKRKFNNYTIELHTVDGDVIDLPKTRLHNSLRYIYNLPFWEYQKIVFREATYGKLLEVDNEGNVWNYTGKKSNAGVMNLKSRHIGKVENYKCWRK